MESITKNRQTPATLRAMVGRAYGAEQVPTGEPESWLEELGHGWFNVAYRILLRDGRAVVVKIAPPRDVPVMPAERGAMRIELDALALITARTDVPVPRVDHADLSHELVDADYFFMPFVDAENFGIITDGLSTERRDAYNEALGAANRELNSIRGSWFGPLPGPGDPSWRRGARLHLRLVEQQHRPRSHRRDRGVRGVSGARVVSPHESGNGATPGRCTGDGCRR